MKTFFNIILTLAVLALIGAGLYRGTEYLWGLLMTLDIQQLTDASLISLSMIISAFVIAIGVRGALKSSAKQRLIPEKAAAYGQMIMDWTTMTDKGGVGVGRRGERLHLVNGNVMLWAGSSLLKECLALEKMVEQEGLNGPKVHGQYEKVVREMRKEIGQNNWGLKAKDLLNMLPENGRTSENIMNDNLVKEAV